MASIDQIRITRAETLDDFWREGMLADTTYLRALIVDGVQPPEATARLNRLKAEKHQPVMPMQPRREYLR